MHMIDSDHRRPGLSSINKRASDRCSSTLLTKIATSTLHAVFLALSNGMRDLLPMHNVPNDPCFHTSLKSKTEKYQE